MKRDAGPHHHRQVMVPFRPWLFWRLCLACGKEFVRERGWKRVSYYGDHGYEVSSVCAECCPTELDAYRALVNRFYEGP